MRQKQRMAIQHPLKIDSFVNLCCQFSDFRIMEVRAHRQHAGQQQRGVD